MHQIPLRICRRSQATLRLYDQMIDVGFQPDAITSTLLIKVASAASIDIKLTICAAIHCTGSSQCMRYCLSALQSNAHHVTEARLGP